MATIPDAGYWPQMVAQQGGKGRLVSSLTDFVVMDKQSQEV